MQAWICAELNIVVLPCRSTATLRKSSCKDENPRLMLDLTHPLRRTQVVLEKIHGTYKSRRKRAYQQKRAYGFGGMCHVDWSIVADHFGKVGKRTAMVQMKMTDEYTIQIVIETTLLSDEFKVWKLFLKNAYVRMTRVTRM